MIKNKIILSLFILISLALIIPSIALASSTVLQLNGLPSGINLTVQLNQGWWMYTNGSQPNKVYNINFTTAGANTSIILPSNIKPISSLTYFQINPAIYSVVVTQRGDQYTYNSVASTEPNDEILYQQNKSIIFSSYLNLTKWYATEANQLIAMGVSQNSSIIKQLTQSQINTILNSNTSAIGTNTVSDRILVQNATNQPIFGSIKNTTTYIPGLSSVQYGLFNKSTGILNFITANVQSNQGYACINLTSFYFQQNYCNAGIFTIPLVSVGGHFGINGPSSITITAKIQSTLAGNNKVPFNALLKVGTNTIMSFSNNNLNSMNQQYTFILNASEPLNITIDGLGNGRNYSPEDPTIGNANIIEYQGYTLQNNQVSAFPANAQINVTVNALKVQQYYTSNLINALWFYANGTVIPSWLEGNVLAEQQATNLYTSANILYWLRLTTSNIFLPANTGVAATNTIYLGWAGNVVTAANTLMNNINTGEAPVLSQSYAKYDTGANVFATYQAWGGSLGSLPSGWAQTLGTFSGGATFSTLAVTTTGGPEYIYESAPTSIKTAPSIVELYGKIAVTAGPLGFGLLNSGFGCAGGVAYSAGTTFYVGNGNSAFCATTTGTAGATNNGIWSAYYISTTNTLSTFNYTKITSQVSTAETVNTLGFTAEAVGGGGDYYVYWTRGRQYPANGIMPAVTAGSPQPACPTPASYPTGLVQYQCIRITNQLNTGLTANTPINITINGTRAGLINVSSTANNIELFWQNGTVALSWLEAINTSNFYQTANAFTSNGILYWFDVPNSAYLPAQSANFIYVGYAANTVNEFNGVRIGEAPQLSTPYGAYDNGANVFSFYDNFKGTSLAGSWTLGSSVTATVSNGVTTSYGSAGGYHNMYNSNTITLPAIIDSLSDASAASAYIGPTFSSTTSELASSATNGGGIGYFIDPSSASGGTWVAGKPAVISLVMMATNSYNGMDNYNIFASSTSPAISASTGNIGLFVSNYLTFGITGFTQWIRARIPPPNNIMPNVQESLLMPVVSLTENTFTASNGLLDKQQWQVLSANVIGAAAPYTYNFLVYNALGGLVYNALYSNSLTTNTFTFHVTTATASDTGTWTANIIVTSSRLTATNSITFGLKNAYIQAGLTASNSPITGGQYELITATTTGGTPAYTENYMVSNTNVKVANSLSLNSLSTNTFFFQLPSGEPGGVYTVNTIQTDSATTNAVVSNTVYFVVCPAGAVNPSASNVLIDDQQYQVITAAIAGCQYPYTVNYLVYNPSGSLTFNALYSNVGNANTITNTFIYQQTGATGKWTVNIIVKDSESSPITFSYNGYSYGVNQTPTISVSPLAANIASGYSTTLTSTAGSGTTPYSYQWYSYHGTSTSPLCIPGNAITGQTGSILSVSPLAANSYTVNLTDSATTSYSVCSSSVPVNVVTDTVTFTPTYSILDSGQNEIYTTSVTAGTAPFTYNIINITGSSTLNTYTNSLTSNTYTFTVNNLGAFSKSLQYRGNISDSETKNLIVNSTINTIIVNPALSVSITPVSQYIVGGSTANIVGTVSGGTPSYLYQWFAQAPGGSSYTATYANTICASPQSNTCSFVTNSLTSQGIFQFILQTTDSASLASVYNSISGSITVTSPLGMPTLTATNTLLDSGQYTTFNAAWSGGSSPFTVNIFNISAGMNLYSTSTYSNSIMYTIQTGATTGSFTFNVAVTDNEPTTLNSIPLTITVNNALVAEPITPKSANIDLGQSILLTSNAVGGSGTISYQWFTHSGTGNPVCNAANIITGTGTTLLVSPTSTNSYNYQVTDSANVPETSCSAKDTITVNSILSPSLTVSNTLIDAGQYILFSGSTGGGTGPWTYNFVVVNAVTQTQVANMLIVNLPLTSNAFLWHTPSNLGGNTVTANLTITDSAYSPMNANTIPSTIMTINPDMNGNIVPVNSIVPQGTSLTLTASPNGGSPGYTYQWFEAAVGAGSYSLISGATSSTYTFVTTPTQTIGNYYFIAQITDSANTPIVSNTASANANVVFVSPITLSLNGGFVPLYGNAIISASCGTCGFDIGLNIISSNGNNVQVANAFNTVSYNFGWPYNSFIGSYKVVASFLADPVSGNINVGVPIYITNYSKPSRLGLIYPNLTNIPICTNNWIGGLCEGNVIYTSNTKLRNNLIVEGNSTVNTITINSGVTLNTSGFLIITNGKYDQIGNVITGFPNNQGIGGCSSQITYGGNVLNSYAGSGGGGETGPPCTGGTGGSTLAPGGVSGSGSGASGGIATASNANILSWLTGGFQNYFAGGGGGGGGDAYPSQSNGSSGAYGLYLQANQISITGVINAASQKTTVITSGNGIAGTGGGGYIVLAYGSGGYASGTYNVLAATVGAAGKGGNGNVLAFNYATPPVNMPIASFFYPYQVYSINPSSSVLLTLNQTVNNIITTLNSSVVNFTYIPPANQLSSYYIYGVHEAQGANTVSFLINASIDMQDISQFYYNDPIIQKYPNFAYCNFLSAPLSWYIQSDISGTTHLNQSNPCGDQFSNANITFIPKIFLNYGWTSFYANTINNKFSINQIQLSFTNTITTANTRSVVGLANFNMTSKTSIIALDIASFSYTINNYTESTLVANMTNAWAIYAPTSNYINPPISLYNISVSGSAENYISVLDNFLPITQIYNMPLNWSIYLPPAGSGTVTINALYCSGGYIGVGYYIVIYEQTPNGYIPVQYYATNGNPISISLPPNILFIIAIYNSAGIRQATLGASDYVNGQTATISLCETVVTPVKAASLSIYCNSTYVGNLLSCNGIDNSNLVSEWKVLIVTHPTIISTFTINSFIVYGNPFHFTYIAPNHTTQFVTLIYALQPLSSGPGGNITTLGYTYQFFGGGINPNPSLAYNLLLGIVLFLLFLGVAYFNEVIAIIALPFVIILGQLIGVFQLDTTMVWGLVATMIITGIVITRFRR